MILKIQQDMVLQKIFLLFNRHGRNMFKLPVMRPAIFVDSLQRSAAGKIDHQKLRALAMERLGLT